MSCCKLFLASFLASAVLCAPVPGNAKQTDTEFHLTLLHTNDTHAHWGGTAKSGQTCYKPLCDEGTGGVLRMERALKAMKMKFPSALLLDAGDQFQGTLFYTYFKSDMAAQIINGLHYDAIIPGNHEFDNSCSEFDSLVAKLDMPVLAANTNLPALSSGKVLPWTILKQDGREIGLIGLANPETAALSSPCPEAVFSQATPALQQAIAEVQARGASIIIVLSHLGLSEDRELARSVDGVDIIVGGHTHSLLSNTDPKAVGPYPIVEKTPAGNPALIVTNGYALKALGCLQVSFDTRGVARHWEGNPIPLNDHELDAMNAPRNDSSTLAASMQRASEELSEKLDHPIGRIITSQIADGTPLERPDVLQCRQQECMTGNLVTDAMLAFWQGKARIALIGGGSIRNSLSAGTVTAADVLAALPFEDHVVRTTMTGKTLLEALEQGLSRYEDRKGFFLQTAGLRYSFNPQNARGKRLVSAETLNERGEWQPVLPETTYSVTTLDFQARGGDGYTMFAKLQWQSSETYLSDLVRDYIANHTSLTTRLEGRISRL